MKRNDFQIDSENRRQKYEIISGIISEIMDEIIFDYETKTDTLNLYIKGNNVKWEYFEVEKYVELKKMEKSILKDDLPRFNEILESAEESVLKKSVAEFRMKIYPERDKEYRWYRFVYSAVGGKDDKHIIGRIVYIDDEKKREEHIVNQHKIDALTEFLNKDAFEANVDEYIRGEGKNGHHAMISIDIDNMGIINSVFGYVFADTVIRDVAEMIKSVFRTTDLIARTGGDEFTVFVKNIQNESAINKAKELCQKIHHIYKTQERAVNVTSSVAVTFYPGDGQYVDVIMKNLDSAMVCAKKDKDTVVCFNDKMTQQKRGHNIKSHMRFHSVSDYDIEFFAYMFSLMTNSMDINTSIDMLLEQTGKHFDLSGICVLENDDTSNKKKYVSNKWDKHDGIVDKDKIQFRKGHGVDLSYLKYDDNDMICINDVREITVPPQNNNMGDDIKSIVLCRFNDNVINQGNVCFYDSDKYRKWTPFETGTFYEISRLLSVFITMRKRNMADERLISKYVKFDMLTGLLKLDAFKERVQKIINKKDENVAAAIIYSDINNFSYVNENFGYDQGDKLLINFADLLLSLGDNRISSRPYSDYFVTYYEDESKEKILENVIKKKNEWFEQHRKKYPAADLHISAGIYFIESNDVDVSTAIENANLARKYFKGNKNIKNEVYTEELRKYKVYEQQVSAELHNDIRDGYLELFLQPKFSLDERTVIGAEALARWRNKDGTYKFPNDFIPVLERVGYIVDLDFYMYEQVLRYMKKWKDMGKKLIPISINFSRIHNYYDNFVDRVTELADKYEIEKCLIEIETTESAMFNNEGVMLSNMKTLHDRGFLIDVDDFGTGFSSLNLIFTAPFDIVKVDKSILSKDISDKDRKYIKRLIDLIYDVEKEVIFEGVETEEQAELLLNCGCVKAQGWLFDKAIHVDEFEKKYIL
jgi:diguanylate cyclase (GGDEF)-like protein